MLATVANLGYVGDVQVNGVNREPIGNYLYGAFGHHFSTSDSREIMVVAISPKQWKSICHATQLSEQLAMIGPMLGLDLQTEEGLYKAREAISAVLKPWFIKRTLKEVAEVFDAAGVLWGPYQDFSQLVTQDPRCSIANPMFGEVEQLRIGKILSPRSPLRFSWSGTPKPFLAPELGEHTSEVIANAQTFF
jgi:2-methylfumaryl-CoA isomerase